MMMWLINLSFLSEKQFLEWLKSEHLKLNIKSRLRKLKHDF